MESKTDRIIGYTLLGIGLFLIIIAAHNVYSTFTGVSVPPQIFKIDNIVIALPNNGGQAELVAAEPATKFMNLMLWYILMFFIAQIGSKIAGLGTFLIRAIKVTVKSKDGLTDIPTQ